MGFALTNLSASPPREGKLVCFADSKRYRNGAAWKMLSLYVTVIFIIIDIKCCVTRLRIKKLSI